MSIFETYFFFHLLRQRFYQKFPHQLCFFGLIL